MVLSSYSYPLLSRTARFHQFHMGHLKMGTIRKIRLGTIRKIRLGTLCNIRLGTLHNIRLGTLRNIRLGTIIRSGFSAGGFGIRINSYGVVRFLDYGDLG